ncbi:hypothetical protein RHSIM_RhsimUnG0175700 [Rhododendron simsii]|uniref:Uncharacterized protein n=1 Tax=Rhododendron simsii TaxID=118357 RepID=A0A834FU45_RHOSS|nr:hypothetical protein RHSIM_RhsimUnG0175700 [Rhododendron simsii]
MFTVVDGMADKIEYMSDLAEVLTDKKIEAVAATAPVISEVAVAAADSVCPVAALYKADTGTELHRLVRNLRDATSKIDGGFVHGIQGGEGFSKVTECLKELRELYSNEGANYYACTSTCNFGMYEADFKWGKPIWVSLGGNEDPMVMNLIHLLDTRSGGEIEAWVNLSEEDMGLNSNVILSYLLHFLGSKSSSY